MPERKPVNNIKSSISIEGALLMLDDTTPHVAVPVQAMRDGRVITTTLSDEGGRYQFSNLKPGSYVIEEVIPTDAGSNPTWTAAGSTTHVVTVSSGQTVGGLSDSTTDFRNTSSVDISGTKYHDLNADGSLNDGGATLNGWTVKVYLDDGDGTLETGEDQLVATEVTAGSGDWSATLNALGPSDIRETAIAGVWLVTHRNASGEIAGRYIEITRMPAILESQDADILRGIAALGERLAQGGAAHDGEHNDGSTSDTG